MMRTGQAGLFSTVEYPKNQSVGLRFSTSGALSLWGQRISLLTAWTCAAVGGIAPVKGPHRRGSASDGIGVL